MENNWQEIWQNKYLNGDVSHINDGFDNLSLSQWRTLANTFLSLIEIGVENPETFGHRFRKVSDSDSGKFRTVIPESFGHFRSIDRNNI